MCVCVDEYNREHHDAAAFLYISIRDAFFNFNFMGLKKRDTNNELTIRLIRSHQQVVTKAEWIATGRSICWLAGQSVGWLVG